MKKVALNFLIIKEKFSLLQLHHNLDILKHEFEMLKGMDF